MRRDATQLSVAMAPPDGRQYGMHVQQEYLSHTARKHGRKQPRATQKTAQLQRPCNIRTVLTSRATSPGQDTRSSTPVTMGMGLDIGQTQTVLVRVKPSECGRGCTCSTCMTHHIRWKPCSTAPPRAVASREGAACNRSAERTRRSRSLQRNDGPIEARKRRARGLLSLSPPSCLARS